MRLGGVFHDGETAARHDATVEVQGDRLRISLKDGSPLADWPLDDIREVRDHGWERALVLHVPPHEARLVVTGRFDIRELRQATPRIKRAVVDKRQLSRVFWWTGGAAAALALLLFVIIPGLADQLARWIPPEREVAFGKSIGKQFARLLVEDDDPYCEGEAALAILAQMSDRLIRDTDLPYPIEVRVMNHSMVNAFALPGGQVVLMRGLIEAADTADEVAAVLAHEIGHVVHRDPTRISLRAAGSAGLLGLLFGDVTGGSVAAIMTDQLMQASYTREAEAAADAFAHDAMEANGISVQALADFFARLREDHGDSDGIATAFLSHPRLSDRIAAAEAAATGASLPALSPGNWATLRAVCRD